MGKQYSVKCHRMDIDGNGIVEFNGSAFHVPYLLDGESAKIELVFNKSAEKIAKRYNFDEDSLYAFADETDNINAQCALNEKPCRPSKPGKAAEAADKTLADGTKAVMACAVEIENLSKDRVNPKCPVYYKCGGCTLLHASYEKQLDIKQKACEELLGKYCFVSKIIGMKEPFNYRYKVNATFANGRQINKAVSGQEKKGVNAKISTGRGISSQKRTANRRYELIAGTYEENSHSVVSSRDCRIQSKKANEVIDTVRRLLMDFKIEAYNEDRHTGLVRHCLVRIGYNSGEIMVVIVIAENVFPGKNNFIKKLIELQPDITTVLFNINKGTDSMVLGRSYTAGYGKGYITDSCMGIIFKISPESFFQVNPVQMKVLYEKAIEFAELKPEDSVLDAYCGTGTIALLAARCSGMVTGVEINPKAVDDAKQNRLINKGKLKAKTEFICADASEFLSAEAEAEESSDVSSDKKISDRFDVVFMDPPRNGSTLTFLNALLKSMPKKIIYISCNPRTLARDLNVLTKDNKYKAEKIQPVDMFTQTGHVETVVLMSRVENQP